MPSNSEFISSEEISSILPHYQIFPDEYYENYGFLNLTTPTLDAILSPATFLTEDAIETISKPEQYVHDSVIFHYLMSICSVVRRKNQSKIILIHPQYFAR